ncbi:alpha-N-arabinofuranosidase [Chloroflexota bacterium]
MNRIRIDPERVIGEIDRNIFGGFAEHLGRCIYGGIYEPGSPLADKQGFRKDVLNALRRLGMPIIRYPGGNFVSGYRWRDGVGPESERQTRTDLAWNDVETNRFGTNEFIEFCRKLKTEPYMVVNCGDGDMREARDWVEYCNGTRDSALVKLRREHGYSEPHNVRYWGIGNEVDGHWQIGYKTPQEYARAFTEFGKAMKWVDPGIKLVASAISDWKDELVERTCLLLEQAGDLIDYLSLHWYVGNAANDFAAYMAVSELLEERLSAYEGLMRAMVFERQIKRPIYIAIDEWNVWYRTYGPEKREKKLEEIYNLEDALITAVQLNAFIRHARTVKMANIAQIVNVIAPVFTNQEGLALQTIFYPFELYSRTCGNLALDTWWEGDTFSGGGHKGLRLLDVTSTLDETDRRLTVYVVNRSESSEMEAEIRLVGAEFKGNVNVYIVNGPDIKAENTFETPSRVQTKESRITARNHTLNFIFEPHSVTALVCDIT